MTDAQNRQPPRPPRLTAAVRAAIRSVISDAEVSCDERESYNSKATEARDRRVRRGIAWLEAWLDDAAAARRHERQARRLLADARYEFVCELGTNTERDLRDNANLVATQRLVDRIDRWLAADDERESAKASPRSPDP